jgi:DNA-binding transcriptional ArsR family regulator
MSQAATDNTRNAHEQGTPPAPSTALALALEAGQDVGTRDRFIAQAVAAGDSPSVAADFLGLSRQQIYAVVEAQRQIEGTEAQQLTPEQESAWRATENRLEEMTSGEDFERLVQVLLYDIDPTVRPLGGVGDRARDAAADLAHGDGSVYSISLEKEWTRKVRSEVRRVLGFGHKPAFVYAITNRKTTRAAEDRLERWADGQGVRLRVLGQRWLVTKLLHPEYRDLRSEVLGLAAVQPRVFLEPGEYRRLLNARPASLGLDVERVGPDEPTARLSQCLESRPAVVLSGPGGIGKTRLVLDLAENAKPGQVWRFLDEASAVTPEALAELGGYGEMVVVLDNAHRRRDLKQVLGLLERRQPTPKIVFVVRPNRVESVEQAAGSVWIGPLSERDYLEVRRLEDPDIAKLVKSPPFNLDYDGMVRAVVELAEGNPQIAVLAATLARDGVSIAELSHTEIFAQHVSGLLSTIADRAAEPRQLRELLAIVSAVGSIDREDEHAVKVSGELLGFSSPAIRRWLSELADLGLLIEQREGRFVIKPDLLAEHVLVSSFFTHRWQPVLDYRDVLAAFAPKHLLKMCSALGRVPGSQLDPQHPGLRALQAWIAPTVASGDLKTAAELIRALLPGAENLILDYFQALVKRCEDDPNVLRGEAGKTLVEATQGVNEDVAAGWKLLLRLMAATADPKTVDAARVAMNSIFQRVPVQVSDRDAWILATVQGTLTNVTRGYARRARTAGELRAATAAGQALLATTFESSTMSVERENEIVLHSYALPGTPATEEALLVGVDVITSTFLRIDIAEQLRSIEAVTELGRRAAGFAGAFGIRLSTDARAMANKALSEFDQFMIDSFNELSLPARSAALAYLLARREWTTRSPDNEEPTPPERLPPLPARTDELEEYITLFYPKPVDAPRLVSWEENERAKRERCTQVAQRLASEADWREHLERWEGWREQATDLFGGDTTLSSSYPVGIVLADVAQQTPKRAVEIIDQLINTDSVLRTDTGRAINQLVAAGTVARTTVARWLKADDTTRATLAVAVGDLDSELAVRTFRELASDPSVTVRRSVLTGLRYGRTTSEWRIALGLRIAGELADIDALNTILKVAEAADLRLTAELGKEAKQALVRTAEVERLDTHDLTDTLRRLEPLTGDLAMLWVWQRIEWLQNASQRNWMIDLLPDALAPSIREHATPADLSQALQRFEMSDMSSLAGEALRTLLNWIDPGSPAITELIVRLYDDPDKTKRAYLLLHLDISWEACRARAEVLAERLDEEAVTELVDSMLPRTYSPGSYEHIENALEHVRSWTKPTADASFVHAVGASIAMLERTLSRERERNRREAELSTLT